MTLASYVSDFRHKMFLSFSRIAEISCKPLDILIGQCSNSSSVNNILKRNLFFPSSKVIITLTIAYVIQRLLQFDNENIENVIVIFSRLIT